MLKKLTMEVRNEFRQIHFVKIHKRNCKSKFDAVQIHITIYNFISNLTPLASARKFITFQLAIEPSRSSKTSSGVPAHFLN